MSGTRYLERPGAPTIAYEIARPATATRGAVLVSHGFAEHRLRYAELVAALVARGLMVCSYDLRGHGASGGIRGYIDRFDEYVGDADDLLASLAEDADWRACGPAVLVGHSLGGLIAFHVALSDPGVVRGVVLSSPFFGLALEVPWAKRAAGHVMSRAYPSFALPTGLGGRDVTSDPGRARAYDEDPLVLKKATARWFTETRAAQHTALERAPSMLLPLVILQAGDDRVASAAASRAVFDRVGSVHKEFTLATGDNHEIFNERDRAKWLSVAADAALSMAVGGGAENAPRRAV